MEHFQSGYLFGQFLRNLHHWSANLLILVAFLHLVRVFYSMSIFHERRKNWQYGLILMLLVVCSCFTGYLLPWDQLSYWAVTIVTGMFEYIPLAGHKLAQVLLDGNEIGEQTLLRFYHFHTTLLPLLLVVLITIHFWLIRKAGGIALPQADSELVETHPNLTYREAYVALLVLIVLFLLAMFVDAPLHGKANPLQSPNPTKAPWYFLGFQELLINVHPLFAAFLIPLAVTLFFVSIPFLNYNQLNTGQWFHSETGKTMTIWSAAFAVLFTFVFILLNDKVFDFSRRLPDWPGWIAGGILPCLLYGLPTAAFVNYCRKKFGAVKIEVVISLVTIILCSYVTMLFISWFLRGEGMQLIF